MKSRNKSKKGKKSHDLFSPREIATQYQSAENAFSMDDVNNSTGRKESTAREANTPRDVTTPQAIDTPRSSQRKEERV
jgi:hypothetical protein